MKRKYPCDLTDSQWNHIKDLFPVSKQAGRPREVDFIKRLRKIYRNERNNDSDCHDSFNASPIKTFLSFQTVSKDSSRKMIFENHQSRSKHNIFPLHFRTTDDLF